MGTLQRNIHKTNYGDVFDLYFNLRKKLQVPFPRYVY